MGNNFYQTGKSGQLKLYSGQTEPDMRQELNNTFDGKWPEVAKAQSAALRKMRRDPKGVLEECQCVDILTHEPDIDSFCPICHGEGFVWDEISVDVYKVVLRSDVGLSSKEDLIRPGLLNIPFVIFYMRSTVDITKEDKVVELVLKTNGKPVMPFRREFLYRIGTSVDLRSDNGKLEYWKLDCYAEQRKFLNGLDR